MKLRRWALLLLIFCILAGCFITMENNRDTFADWYDARNLSPELLLCDRLDSGAERINLSKYRLSVQEFESLWQETLFNHPELFYVSSAYQYTIFNDLIVTVEPEYILSSFHRRVTKADYTLALQNALREVDPDWSDLEIALYLHDWVALHCVYDNELEHHTAYDLFTAGTGVCQAYAQAYQALLTECGIPCRFVLSEEMDHAWVEVQVDGAWYHVDVTYDDPTFDRLGRVLHSYFLLSDEALSQDHTGVEAPYPCTSDRYDNSIWSHVTSAFVPIGKTFYCISGNQVCRWEKNDFDPLYTIENLWYVQGEPNSYWEGCFSALATDGTALLFNTPNAVMRYDPEGGTISTLYSYDGEGDLYGFTFASNTLTCQIASSPNEPGEFITIELQ